ncbi:MAG: hypothetical protein QXR17_05440 [Candidatus Bathyarchaeia archaeon]
MEKELFASDTVMSLTILGSSKVFKHEMYRRFLKMKKENTPLWLLIFLGGDLHVKEGKEEG